MEKKTNTRALFGIGILTNAFNVAISAAILFLTAGRTDWPFAWLYFICYFIFRLVSLHLSLRHIQQHNKNQKTPFFDQILDTAYGLTHPFTLLFAGFEFSFTQDPYALGIPVQSIAFVFLILTFTLMLWSQWENKNYFSSYVNFQEEQNIINTGPYQFIRHPGYAGLFLLALVRPLVIGSWLGVFTGFIGAVIIIVRTFREDRFLQKNSEAYQQYAQAVRHRIFSNLW